MPLLRVSLSIVVNTDQVDIGAGSLFIDTKNMSQEDWIDTMRQYVADYPDGVLEMLQEDDMLEQVADNAQVEYVSAS
jgi:hypothetical protein